MSHSATVDHAYRLQPHDLEQGPLRLTISAVSLQGMEAAQPLAHFAETRKRLLLHPDHCRTLILLSGSAHFHDWVGHPIELRLVDADGRRAIVLLPAPEKLGSRLRRRIAVRIASVVARVRRLILALAHSWPRWRPYLVVVILAVVSYFYARSYGNELVQALQALVYGNGG